jgi:hypothetical protein
MTAAEVLDAVDRIIEAGGDSTDILQGAVTTIVQCGGALWAAVLFNDEGELILGPHAGVAEPGARRRAPIVFEGALRGELAVDGLDDQALIDHAAHVLAPYCRPPQEDLE